MLYRKLLDVLVTEHKAGLDELFNFPPIDTFRRMIRPQPKWKEDLMKLRHKTTPLIYAICLQKYKIMDKLLKLKASASISDQDGVTPLMYAARLVSRHLTKMRSLL